MAKFRGVYARGDTFEAYVGHEGQRLFLGRFRTAEEAARAYDAKAARLLGAEANLNFPGEPMQQEATDADIQDYRNGRERRMVPPKDVRTLRIADLKIDGGTQSREGLDKATVDRYAELMKPSTDEEGKEHPGVEFPPGLCFHDGTTNWVSRGFHRIAARLAAGFKDIRMEVKPGGRRDALKHSIGSNKENGLPDSDKSFRYQLRILMLDAEWCKLSNRECADWIGCTHTWANKVRREIEQEEAAGGHPQETEQDSEKRGKRFGAKFDKAVDASRGDDVKNESPGDVEQVETSFHSDEEVPAEPEPTLPERLEPVFAEIPEIEKACESQRWVSAALNQLRKHPGWQLHSDILDEAWRHSKAIYQALSNAHPECPCLDCGATKAKCGTCKSSGWMNADQAEAWRRAHPED